MAAGREDALTVHRLPLPHLLRRTFAKTNPIEPAFSVLEGGTKCSEPYLQGMTTIVFYIVILMNNAARGCWKKVSACRAAVL